MKRLSGQTTTPVLELGREVVSGSARILERLEQELPTPALYPEGASERRRALEIQAEFDRDVGPAVRTLLFSQLLLEPGYMCRMFARDFSLPQRLGYRAAFPIARGLIQRAYSTSEAENVARCRERTEQALAFIERQAGRSGPLVGKRFSVADLCCAALLAPLFDTPHADMARPRPVPSRLSAFLEAWVRHPAGDWVRDQYRRHRDGAS
jgi:glutathione S-transferase